VTSPDVVNNLKASQKRLMVIMKQLGASDRSTLAYKMGLTRKSKAGKAPQPNIGLISKMLYELLRLQLVESDRLHIKWWVSEDVE
jgi:hypothetical protein